MSNNASANDNNVSSSISAQNNFSVPSVSAPSTDPTLRPLGIFRDTLVPSSSFLSNTNTPTSQSMPVGGWMGSQPPQLPPSAFGNLVPSAHRLHQQPSGSTMLLSGIPTIPPPSATSHKTESERSGSTSLSRLNEDEEDDVKQSSQIASSAKDQAGLDLNLFSSKTNSAYPIPQPTREKMSGLQRNAFTAHMANLHQPRLSPTRREMEVDGEDGDIEMKMNNLAKNVDQPAMNPMGNLAPVSQRMGPGPPKTSANVGNRARKRQRDGGDTDILAAKRTHSESSDSVANARSRSKTTRTMNIQIANRSAFIQLDPVSKNPLVLDRLREAKMLSERGKLEEALEIYTDILTKYEEFNIEALNGKGCIHRAFSQTVSAAACFDKIVKKYPNNWSACHNRASLYEDAGLHRAAIRLFTDAHQAAMTQRSRLVLGVTTTKQQLAQLDMTSHREEIGKMRGHQQMYEEALQEMEKNLQMIRTHMAMSMTDLGTKMKFSGDINEACHCYEVALQWAKDYAPAYYNLGVAAAELGFFADALQYYTAALERKPDYVEALCNVGVIFKNAGNVEEAIECYMRALRHSNGGRSPAKCNLLLNNNLAVAFNDLGTKLKDTDMMAAIRAYKKALVHNPKSADAWYNLGVAHSETGNMEESILSYKMCLMMNPSCEHAYNNMGVIYKDCNNLAEALNNYEAALKINPKFCHALNNMSVLHTMVGSIEDGFKFAKRTIEEDPTYSEAHNNLGVLHRHESKIMEAILAYERCLELNPKSQNASQNRLLAMNYTTHRSVDQISRAHFKWGQEFFYKTHSVVPFSTWPCIESLRAANGQSRQLVIGFISPDFFNHSVSYFFHSYLRNIDQANTRVILYSNVVCEDDKTELFKSLVEEFVTIRHMRSAEDIAKRIRDEDQVDVLVELAGHTANNCLHVMAYKPAPVCVTWIGYPNTTGLPTIDYRFTDEIVDPTSMCRRVNVFDAADGEFDSIGEDQKNDSNVFSGNNREQMYSEELVRIPNCFLCYTPIEDLPRVEVLPFSRNGFVTFGSFNNSAKVTDEVVELWCECMKEAGESTRFVMKCKPLADDGVREDFFSKFERFGIRRKYVDLLPIVANTREHLSLYNMIDVALDTFPYAGTTTTCEAMIMGVPTVALGQHVPHNHAHNVGVTLNSQIDALRDGFIAWSKKDYVAAATSWCRTPEQINRMNNLRCTLRQKMLTSPLCDAVTHTRNVNELFFTLFEKYLESRS